MRRVPGLYQSDLYGSRNFFLTWEGIAVLAVTAISAGLSAYSQVSAGDNAKETASYNAEMQQRAAKDALQRGASDAADKRQQTRRLIARQSAVMGASGFDPNSGTNLSLMTETAGQGELDALKIKNNAQRVASGLEAQAVLTTSQGNAAQNAGYFNAAGSILSGVGKGALSAYKITSDSTGSGKVTEDNWDK